MATREIDILKVVPKASGQEVITTITIRSKERVSPRMCQSELTYIGSQAYLRERILLDVGEGGFKRLFGIASSVASNLMLASKEEGKFGLLHLEEHANSQNGPFGDYEKSKAVMLKLGRATVLANEKGIVEISFSSLSTDQEKDEPRACGELARRVLDGYKNTFGIANMRRNLFDDMPD